MPRSSLATALALAVSGLLVSLNASASEPKTVTSSNYITYEPISGGRAKPECIRPYSLQIFESGRVVYRGVSCVREVGVREMHIPTTDAHGWIRWLMAAGFMDLPS